MVVIDKKEIVKSRILLSDLMDAADISKLQFRMTFTYKGREFDSDTFYFQNVNEPMSGKNPSLTIEVGDGDNDTHFHDLGVDYTPSDHTWVGAKLGIYALSGDTKEGSKGYADFREFKVNKL